MSTDIFRNLSVMAVKEAIEGTNAMAGTAQNTLDHAGSMQTRKSTRRRVGAAGKDQKRLESGTGEVGRLSESTSPFT